MAALSAAASRRAASARAGSARRYRAALAIMPSVVSIPPKSSTAALEMIWSADRVPSCAALAGAERPRKRRAVAVVLEAVETEHAGPHHLGRGEPRIVDRERVRGAHRRQNEVVAGDQPTLEARQPRHRLGGTEAGQGRVGVA